MERIISTSETTKTPEFPTVTNRDIERQAQSILEDDYNSYEVLGAFYDEFKRRYAVPFKKNPIKTKGKALQSLRTITLSAFSSVMQTEATRRIMPLLETGGNLLIAGADMPFIQEPRPQNGNTYMHYTGGAAHYLFGLSDFLRTGAQETITDMEDTTHPHHHLRNCVLKVDYDFRRWSTEHGADHNIGQSRTYVLGSEFILDTWPLDTVDDNAKISLETMLNFWLSYSRTHNKVPSKEAFLMHYLQYDLKGMIEIT